MTCTIRRKSPVSFAAACCTAFVAGIFLSGCDGLQSEKDPVTGGDYGPVTTEMLTGATLNGRTGRDRSFGDLQWTFEEDTFQITAGKNGLPPVLAECLLPAGVTASEISGQWTVANDVITFSQIVADDKDVDQLPRTLKKDSPVNGTSATVFRLTDCP
jgi:hypothetical protein